MRRLSGLLLMATGVLDLLVRAYVMSAVRVDTPLVVRLESNGSGLPCQGVAVPALHGLLHSPQIPASRNV